MSVAGVIKGLRSRWARAWTNQRLSARPARYDLGRPNWGRSLQDPNGFYLEGLRFYLRELPAALRQHRVWFHNVPGNRRGFGEDPFHVMWYLLLEEFKPANLLEIGVYRGQVISLAALWARESGRSCAVHGISPFSSAGDSVSRYRGDLDYLADTLANFDHFHLPRPELLKGYSTDAAALALIGSRAWEMIYIDGSHEYEVARADWEACSKSLKVGGVIVLDDAGLGTRYRPPSFASGGHPGPSRVAREIDAARFQEILQVGHNRAFLKVA
jgi:hypothetical protein